MRFVVILACVAFVVGVALPESASADVLLLKDGRIVDGRKLSRAEGGVKIHYENGEVMVPSALIEDAIIEGDLESYVPQNDEEKALLEKGLVPFDGEWIKPDKREKLIEKKLKEKRALIDDIRAHSEWKDKREENTRNFRFQSTVPFHIFQHYRDTMEAYFKEFSKTWGVRRPREEEPLLVCFYTNYKEFLRTGGVGDGVLGYYRFVNPKELNFYYDRLDPRLTEEVMFHEANHYLQDLIDPDFSVPHFPGESVAEYYGASFYDEAKRKLVVGLIQEGRLTNVKSSISAGDMMPLEKLVSADQMYEHYDWGWTLVHFIMNNKKYEKSFTRWVVALAKAKDIERVPQGNGSLVTVRGVEVWRSFKKYLGLDSDDKVKAFEAEWHEYVKNDLQITSARGKEKAAYDASRTDRRIRAKRLFKEAIDAGSTSALCHFRFAEMLRMDNEDAEAQKLIQKAIELDPLVGDFWFAMAKCLPDGQEAEAKRLAKLALEVDPDDYWLEFEVREFLKN